MKQANCLDLLGSNPQAKYLEAAAHHPERAEPLYECVSLMHAVRLKHCNPTCETEARLIKRCCGHGLEALARARRALGLDAHV